MQRTLVWLGLLPTLSHAMRNILFALPLLLGSACALADTLSIAAASDLLHCLPRLNQRFASQNPGTVIKFTAGASGTFFAQIKAGAPFDLFLSADTDYPQKLVDAGLASELTPYAKGRIALWTTRAELDPAQGFKLLDDSRLQKLAIANPAVAPYGRAAKAALEGAGVLPRLGGKLVQGENIAQTAQYVQSGNADAGIVSYSLLKAADSRPGGRYWLIPAELHPPIRQAGIVVAASNHKAIASRYLQALTGEQGKQLLISCGFDLP
ncbi:molybdate ABC transporter substrate-binding protein [Chitinimonas sp.]|uniref:molybdate ABC transporter substrate-binding protein n=1 Tax=Chitinimonas sp. TaxID=1934313 RepID=UPI0035B3355E